MVRRTLALVAILLVLATGCVPYVGTTGPRVSFHGDSMGAQADRQIVNHLKRGHRVFRFSAERAVTADMVPVVRQMMQEGPVPQVVIVELGAGDANDRHGDARMRRDIRRILDLVRPVPCVRWLSLKLRGVNGFYQGYVARADDFNRILTNQVRQYPNARVAPYKQWANAHPGAFKADGLHHTRVGKSRFAEFVTGVARNCP